MKKTFLVIFTGLFILSGCGQTGPLVLTEKLPEEKLSSKQETIPVKKEQTNVKSKKSS